MKNTLKMFGIIAIVAVIGFWSVSCGDDDGGGGNAISGNTITSGEEVVYGSSIKDVAEAKNVTDFGFMYYWDEKNDTEKLKPLSYFLDGSPSITINNNKVTIILGTPKSAYLKNISELIDENDDKHSITINKDMVTPNNAKFFFDLSDFSTADGKYFCICLKDDNNFVYICYVDRNVTIKGSYTEDYYGTILNYNCSLKKGWNYIVMSFNETKDTVTYTSSTTQPNGYKWTVYARDDRY